MHIGISALGVAFALAGAILLAVGAQLQHRGVGAVRRDVGETRRGSLRPRDAVRLMTTGSWLAGVLVTGLGMALNLVSLRLAPLIVVQPLGVIALVVAALLDARANSSPLSGRSFWAMGLAVAGVAGFVSVATVTARNRNVSDLSLNEVLAALIVAVALLLPAFVLFGRRFPAIVNVVVAGVLAGFVVTLVKALVTRVSLGNIGWLSVAAAVVIVVVAVTGVYFTQRAYASGPVHVIVAGLTVVDPIVSVALGVFSLNEAASTPPWAISAYGISGAAAILGVFALTRSDPGVPSGGAVTPLPTETRPLPSP
jgi:hypothetical protein